MRKSNQEITDHGIIEEILSKSMICRIAMVDEGKPYVLPFNYGYSNRCIYIHAARSGRKTDILRRNPQVSFLVEDTVSVIPADQHCAWSTLYRSVTGEGIAGILTEEQQKMEGLRIIMLQHGADGPMKFDEKELKKMLIIKVTLTSVTGKQSGNWNRIMEEQSVSLETDRMQLEEITRKDIELIHELHSIPEVDEFNTLGIPRTIQDTIKITEPLLNSKRAYPRGRYEWKIMLKGSSQFIGLAGLTLSNDKFRIGEIYYKLHPEHWGNGYATEVAKCLIRSGFDNFGLHKIEAGVAVGNDRSVRVLEKCGMTREGLRRKILPIRGEWVDNWHYAIVETDRVNY